MAQLPPLISPNLTSNVTALQFDSTIDIQTMGSRVNSFGEVDRSDDNWSTADGLTGIPALIQPWSASSSGSSVSEPRKADLTASISTYRITLSGYYPAIVPFQRAVDENGIKYNIIGVQSRSLTVTVLKAEVVIPGAAI